MLSEAEEEVGIRVCLCVLSCLGKYAASLDLEFDAVFQRAGQEGKTMRKTDKKIIRYNLCVKGHLTDCFPSCLSAAQFNCTVKLRNGFVHCFNLVTEKKKTTAPLPLLPPAYFVFFVANQDEGKGKLLPEFSKPL